MEGVQATHDILAAGRDIFHVSLPAVWQPLRQLPPVPPGFVGRREDMELLLTREHKNGVMLTGLRGMAGIGKTALALKLAHEWAPNYPDAQLYLDGQGLAKSPPSYGDLMEQVVRAFHPKIGQLDPNDIVANYHATLSKKRVLIVVDNASGQSQVEPLIPAQGCALIVTSRKDFPIGGITAYPVGQLPEHEAITLLRESRATLSDTEAAALAKLCGRLPLTLKLARDRLTMDAGDPNGVTRYLAALRNGPLGPLNADAEYAGTITISEALRLSENLVKPEVRGAWRKLGVFTASFDEAAAQAVADADAAMLGLLVRLSLLEREVDRYKIHDLAAEYGREKLTADELTTAYFAYVAHYTAVGNEADALYEKGGDNVLLGLQLYDREQAHLDSAFEWLRSRKDLASAKALLGLVDSIIQTGRAFRFHPRKCIHWLETERNAAQLTNDHPALTGTLLGLGNAYLALGEVRKAIEFYEQRIAIAHGTGDRNDEGPVLNNLGVAYAALGETRKAIGLYERRLAFARETGDRKGEGAVLSNLGIAYKGLGEVHKAIEFYKQCLAIARETGDREGEGHTLGNLGNAYSQLGEVINAIRYYERCLTIALELGDRGSESNALWNSALDLHRLGDRAEAMRRAEDALKIFEAIENPSAAAVRSQLKEWRGEGKG